MVGFLGGIIFTGFAIGFFISLAIVVPLIIYCLPYSIWVGVQNNAGKHKDKLKDGFGKNIINATKLYKAWITHTEPTF